MRIHRQVRTMRAQDNGRLTMHDRRVIRRRQNVASAKSSAPSITTAAIG